MGNQKDRQFVLPKNIRQMGKFGETYKIYVEDFVYTYVHRTLQEEQNEVDFAAAVLLGRRFNRAGQEYLFISGAQQVDFRGTGSQLMEEPDLSEEEVPVAAVSTQERQQMFWEQVYQGIKAYFSEYELLGWYFCVDGSNLEVTASMQQFFDATQEHGSHFLYLADRLNHTDAFFVQEQGSLQRLDGYAVYYEKNPAMQEFLVAQNRHSDPVRNVIKNEMTAREDVAQNYRAILNKLNEKPARKKYQPFVYAAGIAVLAVVAATGISQIGNYQNLKTLEQTLQTFSGNVQRSSTSDGTDSESESKQSESDENRGNKDGQSEENITDQTQNTEKPDSENQMETSSEKTDGGEGTSSTTDPASETGNAGDGVTAPSVDATNQGDAVTQNAAETAGVGNGQARYYTVKRGDSLMSISKAVYHTTEMIPEICNVNQIENMDMIYEGQQILLP